MHWLARLIIRGSARLAPKTDRARLTEEWLAELDAVAARGAGAALRFSFGAPKGAWAMRPPTKLLSAIGADLRYAARQLARRPAYTAVVMACLIVGLVASVGMFSFITSIFYGDMPGIAQRRQLLRMNLGYDLAAGYETLSDGKRVVAEPLSYSDFTIVRDLSTTPALDAIGAEGGLLLTATGNHGPVSVDGAFASGDFFRVLRTVPASGRLIAPADDANDAAPVVVVADYFWRTHLDGRPDAIGRPILLSGLSYTVIGVAPPRFHGMRTIDIGQDDSHGAQVWIPMAHAPEWPTRVSLTDPWLTTVSRLTPGSTMRDAQGQLAVAAARISAADPARRAHANAVIRGMGVGPTSSFMVLVLVIAMLALPMIVLAIGCANVANLQLARAAEQTRELAVRLALGATRAQLARLLTIETLARVLAAAAVSIALVFALMRALAPLFPVYLTVDWRVLTFAVGLAFAVALATGLMPAWLVLRKTAAGEMKQSGRSGGLGHARLRNGLVISQVALSLTLLVLSGIFMRTAQNMLTDAPAALREQVVASFNPAELRMSPVEARQFADTIASRVGRDGRVTHTALSAEDGVRFGLPSSPAASDKFAVALRITPSWLDVMQLPFLTGRRLTANDDGSAALISEYAAEIVAPGGSPLGLMLRVDRPNAVAQQVRVVGVVADRPTRPTVDRPDPAIYTVLPNELTGAFTLRVGSAHPEALRSDLMAVINDVDPRIAWASIRRGDMAFEDEAQEMQYAVFGAGLAGLVALILSATGLYAVMSYVVQLRRREIGVRVAIGAQPSRIVAMVLHQAFRLVGLGVACGLALSVPMAFFMRANFVAKVTALDPAVFAPTAALLLLVGAIASIVPSLRAARVNPIETLRQE
jgi:predicted permease